MGIRAATWPPSDYRVSLPENEQSCKQYSFSVSPLLKILDVEIQGLWWKGEILVLG